VSEAGAWGVGVVGFGWMGQVHARAYSRVRQHYPDLARRPRLVAVADPADDGRLRDAVAAYGFEASGPDWRAVVARDDVDAVSVTGPNFIHREVAVAAAEAGKHVWVEKPVGRDVGEARAVAAAVHASGVQSAVGFNYRNAPAVERVRELVGEGRLGRIEQVDIRLLADYSAHPAGALSWRFEAARAGSGVLGDLVCHGADLARYVVGDVTHLVSDAATFIAERPRATGAASHFSRAEGGAPAPVENEDYASALLDFASGAKGTLVASRVAVGEQCAYGIEVHGDRGALAWDFRRMGELRLCLDQDYQDATWQTQLVGPGVGEHGAFQPGAGIAMSYDDLKVIEAARFVRSIEDGKPHGATIDDAVAAADLVAAMQTSARERRWVELSEPTSEQSDAATVTAATSESESER
jgi:predicted dehydrogenase